MLQLQAIVERVAKTMGPVEEGQGDEDEEGKARHRVPDQVADGLVARGLEPSKRDSQPSQQEMDGEKDEEKRDGVQGDEEGRSQASEELGVSIGALRERPQLPQGNRGKKRDEDARELAQNKPGVGAVLEPPPDRDAATVPPWMVQRVAGLRAHRAAPGSRNVL